MIAPGIPAPHFCAPSKTNSGFAFSSLGGRYVVLGFLPPPGPQCDAALAVVRARLGAFVDEDRLFFGVVSDAQSYDEAPDQPPWRWFLDAEGEIAALFGMRDADGRFTPGWVVVDPSLRVLASAPLEQGAALIDWLVGLGAADDHAGVPLHAPVLIVPRIFEPSLCRELMAHYHAKGGQVSGVMRTVDGRTVGFVDDFKRRRDVALEEGSALQEQVRVRLVRRLLPEIEKAFCFKATRVERWMVACYSAEEGGYFRAHRDNGSPGTAHRKFACSINLNADFEGGELVFPEFGWRRYRPPPGGAVVFGCALLHEVTPVTKGLRYAYLPFFYDDEGARIREANRHLLETKAAEA